MYIVIIKRKENKEVLLQVFVFVCGVDVGFGASFAQTSAAGTKTLPRWT